MSKELSARLIGAGVCVGVLALQTHAQTVTHVEQQLLEGVGALLQAQPSNGMDSLSQIAKRQPDFDLARLVYADALYAQMGVLAGIGDASAVPQQASEATVNALQMEASRRVRYAQHKEQAEDRYPNAVIQLAPDFKRLVVVDGQQSRVEVYQQQNGQLLPVQNYYTSVAKHGMHKKVEGDKRTPVGVYFTTQRLAEKGLGALYGAGAIPLNYPNAWDRAQHRSGHGIWLHGVPYTTYNRAPLATNGCVALPNEDYRDLDQTLGLQVTPVIITDQPVAMSASERQQKAQQFSSLLADWQTVQNAQHVEALDTFYSPRLPDDQRLHDAFAGSEANVRHLSIFQYPADEGASEMVMLDFEQYTLELPEQTRRIRQYWSYIGDGWVIAAEETGELLPVHQRGIPAGVRRTKHL